MLVKSPTLFSQASNWSQPTVFKNTDWKILHSGILRYIVIFCIFFSHFYFTKEHHSPSKIQVTYAYQTLIDHWDEFNFKTQVVIHCFSGSREEMVALLNRGCYISFAGNVTYPKVAVYTDDAIRSVPLDKILVETDAPFLVPRKLEKYTNVNQPYYIFETYEYIAKLKGIKVGVLVDKVAENYLTAYKLSEHDIAY